MKTFSLSFLATILSCAILSVSFQPKSAQAAVFGAESLGVRGPALFAIGAGAAIGWGHVMMPRPSDNIFDQMGKAMGLIMGLPVMILLDVDGEQSSDELARLFKKQFPFIDNSETIQSLVSATQSKFETAQKQEVNGARVSMVQFSSQEVNQLLSSTDLTDEQVQSVASELK